MSKWEKEYLYKCVDIAGESVKEFEGVKTYVSTGALDINEICTIKTEEISFDNKPSRANLVVKKDDVIFAKMKDTKKTLLICNETENNIYSSGFYALRSKHNVMDVKYLYTILSTDLFLALKDENCSGATQKALNNEGFKKIQIPLPPIETQKKIASELDKIAQVIKKRKEQIIKIDLLIKAKFVEMFGDPVENIYEFDIIKFKDCIEYMGDIGSNGANAVISKNLNMKDTPDYAVMVRFLNFTANDFEKNVKYIDEKTYEFFSKSKLYGGELIFCKIGSAGLNYLMPFLEKPVSLGLNQILARVKDINIKYLYQYLNTNYGKQLIDGCINGAVTKSITKTALKEIDIVLPPLTLQNQFADYVEKVESTKEKVSKSLEQLEILYKQRMQEYFE